MSKQSLSNTYRFLTFLKKNTDENHPMLQKEMRKALEEQVGGEKAKEMLGDKGTFTRRLRELADALNTDEKGKLLPKEEWKIVYPGYDKLDDAKATRNGRIYYNQPTNDYELNVILQKIEESIEFTVEEKASLKKRLVGALASTTFDSDSIYSRPLIIDLDSTKPQILQINSDKSRYEIDSKEIISQKIKIIRDNIIKKRMLEIQFEKEKSEDNPDDRTKEVRPEDRPKRGRPKKGSKRSERMKDKSKETLRITPYRIVKKDNKYWMVGNRHAFPREDKPWDYYTEDLFAYELDKMTDIKTAHTEKETIIHWTMTKNMPPRRASYKSNTVMVRIGQGSETRARYNADINSKLEILDQKISEMEFGHGTKLL